MDERPAEAAAVARRLLRAFGRERFRIELQRPFWRHDRRRNRLLAELAERLGVPCVATGNVHAHEAARSALQDAMVAVRLGPRSTRRSPPGAATARTCSWRPSGWRSASATTPARWPRAAGWRSGSGFDLNEDLGYRYPGSEDGSADRRLAEVCAARLEGRYAGRATWEEASHRLDEELRVIRHLGLSGFFLLHRDMLELAREVAVEVRGRTAPGRCCLRAAAAARAWPRSSAT